MITKDAMGGLLAIGVYGAMYTGMRLEEKRNDPADGIRWRDFLPLAGIGSYAQRNYDGPSDPPKHFSETAILLAYNAGLILAADKIYKAIF